MRHCPFHACILSFSGYPQTLLFRRCHADHASAWHLASKRIPMSQAVLDSLMESENPWTRMSLLLYCSKQLSPQQTHDIIAVAKTAQQRISFFEYVALISELHSDSFRRREAASVRLTTYGERTIYFLRTFPLSNHSLDAKERINKIVIEIERRSPNTTIKELVFFVQSCAQSPHMRELLVAMAQNPPETTLHQAATKAVAELDAKK